MVFQSYALYPHMTVAQNIGFPLKMVGTPAAEIDARGAAMRRPRSASATCSQRTPGQLSGGQQQRCALARAIVRQPRLFLLDEPLSNLDAKLRLETRLELHALQRALGVTTVYVTHDQEEAMTLADRIAVFMDGRIVQVGTPREIFARPADVAVAGFIGTPPMNLLPGAWEAACVERRRRTRCRCAVAPAGRATVTLGVRPGDLRIARRRHAGARRARRGPGRQRHRQPRLAGEQLLKLKTDRLPPCAKARRSSCGFAPERGAPVRPRTAARGCRARSLHRQETAHDASNRTSC